MRPAAASMRTTSALGLLRHVVAACRSSRSQYMRILRSGSCRSCAATEANCSSSAFERVSACARRSASSVRSATFASSVSLRAVTSACATAS